MQCSAVQLSSSYIRDRTGLRRNYSFHGFHISMYLLYHLEIYNHHHNVLLLLSDVHDCHQTNKTMSTSFLSGSSWSTASLGHLDQGRKALQPRHQWWWWWWLWENGHHLLFLVVCDLGASDVQKESRNNSSFRLILEANKTAAACVMVVAYAGDEDRTCIASYANGRQGLLTVLRIYGVVVNLRPKAQQHHCNQSSQMGSIRSSQTCHHLWSIHYDHLPCAY